MIDESFKNRYIRVVKGSIGTFRELSVVTFGKDIRVDLNHDIEGKLIGIGKKGFQVLHKDYVYSFYYANAGYKILDYEQTII